MVTQSNKETFLRKIYKNHEKCTPFDTPRSSLNFSQLINGQANTFESTNKKAYDIFHKLTCNLIYSQRNGMHIMQNPLQ